MGAGISTVNEYVASSGDRLTYDIWKKKLPIWTEYELGSLARFWVINEPLR